jgi:hypothetical protein
MSDDQENAKNAAGLSVQKSRGIDLNGEMFYPISNAVSELNPCAGKENGVTCGAGCVCRNGQCYYTLFRLRQMRIRIQDK